MPTSLEHILLYCGGTYLVLYLLLTIVTFQTMAPIPDNLYLPPNLSTTRGGSASAAYEAIMKNFSSNGSGDAPGFAFPQSIHDAPYEDITHPAVEIIPSLISTIGSLKVPIFFDPPEFREDNGGKDIRAYLGNYGDELMTLEQAQRIGSHTLVPKKKDSKGDAKGKGKVKGKGEDENVMILEETIFVAIASYRDFQCRQTIESVLSRATHPGRVRVAVVDQYDYQVDTPCSQPERPCEEDPSQILCKYKDQIDFFDMEAQFAMGPVFARHLGNRMYRGEYYAMQSDAHVDFVNDWDTRIIQQWKNSKNEMAVLTAYLSDIHDSLDEEGNLLRFSRPIMCKSDWEGHGVTQHMRHGQQPEGPAGIKGEPTLEPFWAAGYSFARGHFIVNVPYDQHLPWVFQGEEISIGLRGFTYGYDYYTPETSVCFHYYARQDKSGGRNKVKLFWENTKSFGGQTISKIERSGMMRLNGIINMNLPKVKDDEWIHIDERKYGLGKVRTTQKFVDTFGIDVEKRKTEDHLCQFAGKNMQFVFKPHLRTNTMGIDYDKISFKFQDPNIHGQTWAKFLPKKSKH
mmetsp:Transcript_22219/g.33862  ORF Transcript_22219/g.33862 Transcript_22219/m.33862 type:complete len:571 (-) Transcript_22219:93-1805(-)